MLIQNELLIQSISDKIETTKDYVIKCIPDVLSETMKGITCNEIIELNSGKIYHITIGLSELARFTDEEI